MNAKIIKSILVGISSVGILGVAASVPIHNMTSLSSDSTPQVATKETKPTVETKIDKKTEEIPFETVYQDDATMAKDTTTVAVEGRNGTRTITYQVTYTDNIETAREKLAEEITTQPTTKIIKRGTYVAPAPQPAQASSTSATSCTSGTYVNSAGNTVCRPSTRNSGDATAICADGTYSYSQSRRGTCSHHGGVSVWL